MVKKLNSEKLAFNKKNSLIIQKISSSGNMAWSGRGHGGAMWIQGTAGNQVPSRCISMEWKVLSWIGRRSKG